MIVYVAIGISVFAGYTGLRLLFGVILPSLFNMFGGLDHAIACMMAEPPPKQPIQRAAAYFEEEYRDEARHLLEREEHPPEGLRAADRRQPPARP